MLPDYDYTVEVLVDCLIDNDKEKLDDNKKIKTIQAIQRTMAIPYSTRAKILTPILNKLIEDKVDSDKLVEEYKLEREDIKINYEEY